MGNDQAMTAEKGQKEPSARLCPPHGWFSKLGSLFWDLFLKGAVLYWALKTGP